MLGRIENFWLFRLIMRLTKEKMRIWEGNDAGFDATESKHTRRQDTLDEWQRRWEQSEKGRETFEYMPNIRRRLERDWQMDHYQTQFMTGRENFKANLRRFNLVEDDRYGCGGLKTATHVMMDCTLQEENRRYLREALQRKNLQWRKQTLRTIRKPSIRSGQSSGGQLEAGRGIEIRRGEERLRQNQDSSGNIPMMPTTERDLLLGFWSTECVRKMSKEAELKSKEAKLR